ncbi:MAG: hypothetical protein ASARMPRED_007901 [Alectoria sarmentosa]|nr:MAG: hypothetical protein ASARMPRED_007901 [Alectoria sarmentosa]
MGLGVFAFATAVIKTVNLTEISANPNDLTYIMFGIQFWFCIENSTLIISATIPTLRPLFTHRKASENATYNVNDRGSYRRWNGTWNEIEAPARQNSISGCSDQIELTGVIREDFGTGTDTECVAAAEGDIRKAGGPLKVPPETGIMKTVSTEVTC